jgi:undecaprenyl diphosphate synthase
MMRKLDVVLNDDRRAGGEEVAVRDGRPARYVAIITDGSARWASGRGFGIGRGHDAAADTLRARIGDAVALGVRELAVYVFSTENWSRPLEEVAGLMEMFSRRIPIEAPGLHREGVRMCFIGEREGLSEELLMQMDQAQALTADNRGMTVFLAFNYGGRAEILQAARSSAGGSEEAFRRALFAADMHDPEVIIRTGGERRLSNFLLWQSAYSELVFRDELWPDFTRGAFEDSLKEFTQRRRRFGGR